MKTVYGLDLIRAAGSSYLVVSSAEAVPVKSSDRSHCLDRLMPSSRASRHCEHQLHRASPGSSAPYTRRVLEQVICVQPELWTLLEPYEKGVLVLTPWCPAVARRSASQR